MLTKPYHNKRFNYKTVSSVQKIDERFINMKKHIINQKKKNFHCSGMFVFSQFIVYSSTKI